MKYIVDKFYGPVIFANGLQHKDVAKQLNLTNIQSAGFVRTSLGEIQCYGDSFTLNIKSRGEVDTELIKEFLKT